MVFIQHGFLPLVIKDAEHKDSYIAALEEADAGNLDNLVRLFANIQSTEIEEAVSFVRDIRGQGIGDIARAAAEAAKRSQSQSDESLRELTVELLDRTAGRLEEVSFELKSAFQQAGIDIGIDVFRSGDENEHYWHGQIVEAAGRYNYWADLNRHRPWVQLRLTPLVPGLSRSHIVISLHHKSARTGLMAAVGFLTTADSGEAEARPLELGTQNEFSFSSTTRNFEEAFKGWLDSCVEKLLAVWQTRI